MRRGRLAMKLPSSPRRWLLALAAIAAVLLALALLVAVLASFASSTQASPEAVRGWMAGAHAVRVWGTVMQAALIALAVIFWRPLMHWLVRRGIAAPHELDRLIACRWHAMAWGAIYLLLIPIGPAAVWQALTSLF